MKKTIFLALAAAGFIFSCSTPTQKASGNYSGQYTYNSSIHQNISAAVTETSSSTVSITFTGSGISTLTISGISAISNGNDVALTKSGFAEALSGAVSGNELSISYSFMSGAVTYVGNK